MEISTLLSGTVGVAHTFGGDSGRGFSQTGLGAVEGAMERELVQCPSAALRQKRGLE